MPIKIVASFDFAQWIFSSGYCVNIYRFKFISAFPRQEKLFAWGMLLVDIGPENKYDGLNLVLLTRPDDITVIFCYQMLLIAVN